MKKYQVKYKTAGGSIVYSYFKNIKDCFTCLKNASNGRILITTVED